MTSFNEEIYRLASQIPRGCVATYGQLAAMAGRPGAARAVGTAMAVTPPYRSIPCHRVIRSDGSLAPSYAFGGEDRQRELLLEEGVVFSGSRVNIKASIWRISSRL